MKLTTFLRRVEEVSLEEIRAVVDVEGKGQQTRTVVTVGVLWP